MVYPVDDQHSKPNPEVVVMIGAFPPPMHGMAAVNAAVCERLVGAGSEILVIDVAAPSLNRSLIQRLGRLPKVLQGLVGLALLRGVRGRPLYMSVSGGWGQVYELGFLIVARLKRMRIVLHHHSFAYLDRRSHLTALLTRLAGKDALHVALSPEMGQRLNMHYPVIGEVMALTNATLLLDDGGCEPKAPVRNALCMVGFLSNISAEKGVFEFLDVCATAQNAGLPLQAKLAGPFQDAETERRIRCRLNALPNVEYVGSQYGEAKTQFYQSIDTLLFPTRYRNEAEPLVLLEAMREGIPVIAYDRGAISEYVDDRCGHVVPVGGDFVAEALQCLRIWLEEAETYQEASKSAQQRFQAIQSDGLVSWERLKGILLTGKDDDSLDAQFKNKTDGVV
jgi:glycosyltransferase involved in cell wall biosynthesis